MPQLVGIAHHRDRGSPAILDVGYHRLEFAESPGAKTSLVAHDGRRSDRDERAGQKFSVHRAAAGRRNTLAKATAGKPERLRTSGAC